MEHIETVDQLRNQPGSGIRGDADERVTKLEAEAWSLRHDVAILSARADGIVDSTRDARAWALIGPGTAWASVAPLRHEPLISVVLATRNRNEPLRHAIQSVMQQSYSHWELVIVDDGSERDCRELVEETADPRIARLESGGVGAAAARNKGLLAARGQYITFLDDDNQMASGWLRAVAEYSGRFPECLAMYGAQIREPEQAEPGRLDLLFVSPFSMEQLRIGNFIDLGALAVRRDHPELRFDEALFAYIDWELMFRLAAHSELIPLPALASFYSTSSSGRISEPRPEREALRLSLQRRFSGSKEQP